MTLLGYRIAPLAKKTGKEILDDNVLGMSAECAYNFFLAIFPFLLFMAPLLSLVGDKQKVFGTIMASVGRSMPPDAYAMFSKVVGDVVYAKGAPGLMSVGALGALWAGSNVFSTLIGALNRAYDVEETRPWWKTKLIAIGTAVLTGIILLLATVVFLGGEGVAKFVGEHIGIGESGIQVWAVLQYPIALIVLIALAWANFMILPNVRVSWKRTMAGAILTTVLWVVVTLVFRLYVQNFGSYNKTYGTIGGIIVLLTWMYLAMMVLLIGGELNSELHHGTGAVDAETQAVDPRAGRLFGTPARAVTSTDRIEQVG